VNRTLTKMVDSPEEQARKDKQSRALDVSKRTGAMIQHRHLNRQQEVVGVTKDDLEDILGFDGIAASFGALGMFLLSGAVWLIADKSLGSDGFTLNALMGFCMASVVFGAACLGAGAFFHAKKRGRISRIFDQTKVVSDQHLPLDGLQATSMTSQDHTTAFRDGR